MKPFFFFFLLSSFFCFSSLPVFALVPNDIRLSEQWYLEKIHAYDAWDITTGSSEVIVAVIDTGIDLNHPDLQQNLWINEEEFPDDGIDNDHNGYIDDRYGWDFITLDGYPDALQSDTYDASSVSHGTLVAGLIAAVGNNLESTTGLVWNTKIMPIRVLDELGSGTSLYAADAIYYAVENGARVINLSFTGLEIDARFLEAIQYAYEQGVLVVAAVGNDSLNVNEAPLYPACFSGEEDWVLGVAATDREDKKADFSNYGSSCVDISAPGVEIYGLLYHEESSQDFLFTDGGYWEGTSTSTPIVSGAVALLLGRFPTLTPSELKLVLQLAADPLAEKGTDAQGQLGAGRLNMARALEIAVSFAPAQETTPVVSPEDFSIEFLAAAQATGSPSEVRYDDSHGNLLQTVDVYAADFSGGVRLAMGDVDGDGQPEVITAPGKGGGPQIRIFKQDGTLLNQFFAFSESSRFGWFVASVDVNGDGKEEIMVAPDAGGDGMVSLFTFQGTLLSSFFPFGATEASIRIGGADVDGDGKDELLASLGAGFEPLVRIFDGDGTQREEFLAYASSYDRGVFVDGGDVNGDGKAEIVTGTDNGGGPHVRIFDEQGTVKGSFFAYDEAFRGGVRIGVGDLNRDAKAEIYTAAGPGGGPHIRIFNEQGSVMGSFFAFDEHLHNGVNVGVW